MDYGLGNIIAGGIGAGASLYGAKRANKQNLEEAQRNRDFQERMSSTAYQRATQDMKKAGLNPMLAYQQGGSSTPQGGQAQLKNIAESIGEQVNATAKNVLDERRQKKIEGKRVSNEEKLMNSKLGVDNATVSLLAAQQNKETQSARQFAASADRLSNENQFLGKLYKHMDENSQYYIFNKMLQSGLESASAVKDLANPIKGLFNKGKKPIGLGR